MNIFFSNYVETPLPPRQEYVMLRLELITKHSVEAVNDYQKTEDK